MNFDLGMASSVSWSCQKCIAKYSSLYDLVSHVRGVHSEEVALNFSCGVQGCSTTFTKTNTWYKHVVKHHRNDYLKKNSSDSSNADSDEDDSYTDITTDGCINDDYISNGYVDINADKVHSFSEGNDTNTNSSDSNSFSHNLSTLPSRYKTFSEDVIAGKLLKIREHYLVSHAAVDEVVHLVQSACDGILSEALFAIWKSGEASGMDMSSDYFQCLPRIFESLTPPLSMINTAYKRHSYIAKKLPYVVSIIVC